MSSREIRNYYKNRGNIRQDYNKKSLQNPFYKKHNEKALNIFSNLKLVSVAISLFIIFIIWLLLFSPVFLIRDIKIDGLVRANESDVLNVVQSQINSRRALIFSQKNLLIFNKGKISSDLLDKFGFLNVNINKGINGQLKISVAERAYAFIWGENGNYYYSDKDGHIVSQIPSNFTPLASLNTPQATSTVVSTSTDASLASSSIIDISSGPSPDILNIQKQALVEVKKNNPANYPIIDNLYNPLIKNDIIDIDHVYFDFVDKINQNINDKNNPSLQINRFFIDSDIDTLKVELNSGLVIYFSTKQDINDQINNFLDLKAKDKLKEIKKKVDLRYGDRIYYE